MEDALTLGEPFTDIAIAMELNYFQLRGAEYFVSLTAKMPGRELALAQAGGTERTSIDLIGLVRDDYGTVIQQLRDKLDFNLNDAMVTHVSGNPIEYDTGFLLLPGRYSIRFLARDEETGRTGTYQANLTVPNLNREVQRIPISSVVLSSQRVDVTGAFYNAPGHNSPIANPLVTGGLKLIPSVTRVFSRNDQMYVYLQAYERDAQSTQPLLAFVTFYSGEVKAMETAPFEVTQGLDPISKGVPLNFSVPLADLPPGNYNCEVTVLDPIGKKSASWTGAITVVP